jgi:hypothetical protein
VVLLLKTLEHNLENIQTAQLVLAKKAAYGTTILTNHSVLVTEVLKAALLLIVVAAVAVLLFKKKEVVLAQPQLQ